MQTMECEESLMKLWKYLYGRYIVVECKGKEVEVSSFLVQNVYDLLRNFFFSNITILLPLNDLGLIFSA